MTHEWLARQKAACASCKQLRIKCDTVRPCSQCVLRDNAKFCQDKVRRRTLLARGVGGANERRRVYRVRAPPHFSNPVLRRCGATRAQHAGAYAPNATWPGPALAACDRTTPRRARR